MTGNSGTEKKYVNGNDESVRGCGTKKKRK